MPNPCARTCPRLDLGSALLHATLLKTPCTSALGCSVRLARRRRASLPDVLRSAPRQRQGALHCRVTLVIAPSPRAPSQQSSFAPDVARQGVGAGSYLSAGGRLRRPKEEPARRSRCEREASPRLSPGGTRHRSRPHRRQAPNPKRSPGLGRLAEAAPPTPATTAALRGARARSYRSGRGRAVRR